MFKWKFRSTLIWIMNYNIYTHNIDIIFIELYNKTWFWGKNTQKHVSGRVTDKEEPFHKTCELLSWGAISNSSRIDFSTGKDWDFETNT